MVPVAILDFRRRVEFGRVPQRARTAEDGVGEQPAPTERALTVPVPEDCLDCAQGLVSKTAGLTCEC